MLARLIVLIASLSFLVNVVDAAGLRALTTESEEVGDDVGARIMKNSMKALRKNTENNSKKTAELLKPLHAEATKRSEQHRANGFQSASNMQAQTLDQNVRYGSIVTRHRPNGDCTGAPYYIFADRILGNCVTTEGGGSFFFSCESDNEKDGDLKLLYTAFGNANCEPSPFSSSTVYDFKKRCSMLPSNGMDITLPAMEASHCTTKHYSFATEKGGFVTYDYGDSPTCGGEPKGVSLQPFHVCDLNVEYFNHDGTPSDYPTYSDKNKYHYYTVDGCAPNGKVEVSVYADPACRRKLRSMKAPIDDNDVCFANTHQDDQGASHTWYSRTVCIPEPGQH